MAADLKRTVEDHVLPLPSLESLAYPNDDGDHEGGGHCAALGDDDFHQGRVNLIDQYITALTVLADAAVKSGYGWSLSRPILFATHQLCELVLDLVLDVAHLTVKLTGKHRHSLGLRMKAATNGGAYDSLKPDDRAWCEQFIERVAPITRNGFPGRYVSARVDRAELDEIWCCVNPIAMRDAAIAFANLSVVVIRAQETTTDPGAVDVSPSSTANADVSESAA